MKEPRRWEMPYEPYDVTRVKDRWGRLWKREQDGYWRAPKPESCLYPWDAMLREHGPLTEAIGNEGQE